MKVAFHVWHVLEWLVFFDGPPLLLVLGKMFEELGLQIIPLHLLEGGAIVVVEGPEDMTKVLLPPCALVISDILQRVFRWGPCTADMLGQGASRCGGWRDIARHPRGVPTLLTRHLLTGRPNGGSLSSSPGATGRPAVIVSALGTPPPAYINVLTARGSRFGGRGVKGDS